MTEEQFQRLVVQWLEVALPNGSVFHHSPNEGLRHVSFQRKLKLAGTKFGWPDLELFVPEEAWKKDRSAIFIELKRPKGGSVSKHQKEIHKLLESVGTRCWVARKLSQISGGLDDLIHLRETAARKRIELIAESAGAWS